MSKPPFGPTWRYTDSTKRVVARDNEDGSQESHLVTVPHIQAWIAAGNTIGEPVLPPAVATSPSGDAS